MQRIHNKKFLTVITVVVILSLYTGVTIAANHPVQSHIASEINGGTLGSGNFHFQGNVGIGTTSPGKMLDVADRIRVRQGPEGTAGMWLYQKTQNADRAFVGMLDDNYVGFYGLSANKWGLLMNVNDGSIGMGGKQPQKHALDIATSFVVANQGGLRVQPTSGGPLAGAEFAALASRNNVWTALYAKQGAAKSAAFFDGKVGIGTENPQSTLHVDGDTRVTGTIFSSNLQVSGTLSAVSITVPGIITGGGSRSDNGCPNKWGSFSCTNRNIPTCSQGTLRKSGVDGTGSGFFYLCIT